MKKLFLLIALLPLMAISQREFDNWHFGYGVSMTFPSGGAPIVNNAGSSIYHNEGSASVSDCSGNLLFYTDGSTVWNRNGGVMTNGTGLFANSSSIISVPATQGALIVKRPESTGIYYIFTASESRGINYSTINMNASGGLGEVIIKNTPLVGRGTQKLAVTYHSNGTDIWVVTHYSDNNQYDAFLVTRTGVNPLPLTSFDGPGHNDGQGDLKISQQGNKIAAVVDFRGRVYLADFNNSNGRVTNTARASGYDNPHGVEFSPDGTKMYINSTTGGIYQFNVNPGSNASTLSSATRVTSVSNVYGSLQLGPDGKIYVANANESYLGVINNPNAAGVASSFDLNGIFVGNGRSGYEVTNATLLSPPSFNGPNSVSYSGACLGQLTTFTLGNTSDIVDIIWEFGDPSSGLFNYSTQLNPTHNYGQVGTYQVSVTITYLCGSETINVPVVISPAPIITLPNPQIVCSGVPTSIGMSPENNVSYSWSPSTGLSNPSSSNPSLTLIGSQEKETITYTLVATNSINGCSTSDQTRIELTTPIVDAGPDITICSDEIDTIGMQPRAGYTYSWSPITFLSSPLQSQSEIQHINSNSTLFSQSYTLTGTLDGCVETDNVLVEVKPLARVENPRDTTICSLDSLTLNVGGNAGASYSWSTPDGLSSTTAVSPVFSVSNKDTGTVEFKKYVEINFDGCTNMDTVTIKVNPQSGIDPYQYLCPGFSVALEPYGKGVSFNWSPNTEISATNIRNPQVNPSFSRWYFVNIVDQFGCIYDDSVFVDVNPLVPVSVGPDTSICREDTILIGSVGHPQNAIYSWNPNAFLSDPDSNYTFAYPDSTRSYVITSSSDTCTGRDTILITVNQLPPVDLLSDSTICRRDTLVLYGSGALTYQWLTTTSLIDLGDSAIVFPSDSIVYYLSGTDTNGCVNVDSAVINVKPLPLINLTPEVEVCLTDSVQVRAEGGGTYTWSPSNFMTDPTAANPFLRPTADTRFIVEVLGPNGCTEWDTVDVTVHPLPSIALTSDTTICEGTNAQLWATGGVSYSWSPSTDLNDSGIQKPVSSTRSPITYQVIVVDQFSCIDSAEVDISINVTPEALFDYSFIPGCEGFATTFTDQSQNADEWYWSFGDGATSTSVNPQHTFAFGRPVTTTLVVGNNNLCFDTAEVFLNWKNLEDIVDVWTSNAVTANNDKINDCFEYTIEGNFAGCTRIEVFNRWGLKVYDSEDTNECFRGINEYNLKPLSAGTYFYNLYVNDYVRNGFITLVEE